MEEREKSSLQKERGNRGKFCGSESQKKSTPNYFCFPLGERLWKKHLRNRGEGSKGEKGGSTDRRGEKTGSGG